MILTARGLSRDYHSHGTVKHALIDVDLDVAAGETLAVIGESGSGKSTLARLLLDLDRPTRGTVTFDGDLRRGTGIVLQDPYASLDPRFTVEKTVAEPLRALKIQGDVGEVLERVGLSKTFAKKFPHELSGGQRQRVALARAIVHRPKLLIGDEPLSALDVTVRAAIVKLLRELNTTLGLAVVLVSHDIGLVQHFAERVVVMHDGRIVESGPTASVLGDPQHPYTRGLVAAVPRLPVRSRDVV